MSLSFRDVGSKSKLVTIAFGSSARLFALASQFGILVLLSWTLTKGELGDMLMVLTTYRMLSFALGSGIGAVLLYHVARAGGGKVAGARLHRTALIIGLLSILLFVFPLVVFRTEAAALFQKPGITGWLLDFAPFAVVSTLSYVTMGDMDGQSRITSAITMTEVIPNAIRLLSLPFFFIFTIPVTYIADVFWISVLVPWAFQIIYLRKDFRDGFAGFTLWDYRYATFSAINSIATAQLQGIDLLIAGYLFPSETVASYAIASRLAALYPFLQQIMLRNFTPRVGNLLSSRNLDQLNSELKTTKMWSMIAIAGLSGLIILASPIILTIMGDFLPAIPIMCMLAAPAAIRTIYAGNDVLLRMTGRAGFNLTISTLAVCIVVAASVLLHDLAGIYAIPLGMLFSSIFLNPITALFLHRRGIKIVNFRDVPIILLCLISIGLGLLVRDPLPTSIITGCGLCATAIWVMFLARRNNQRIGK